MTIEQLLLLAVFVLASLLNLIVQAIRRRRQTGQLPGEAEDVERPPQPTAPLPPSAVYREPVPTAVPVPRPPRRARPAVPALVEAPPPPARRRRRPRVVFRHAADVRRAFVLMTVLGPSRGLEPPGRLGADQPTAAAAPARPA